MGSDAKRTPGKWAQLGSTIYSIENGVICELSEVHSPHRLINHRRIWVGSPDWAEAMANARHIVQACNAHGALVAACGATLAWLARYQLDDLSPASLFLQIEAAIALATEAADE